MPIFEDFHLRKVAELDAMKIYLALAARRDASKNVTRITYNQMSDYAGVPIKRVRHQIVWNDAIEFPDLSPSC